MNHPIYMTRGPQAFYGQSGYIMRPQEQQQQRPQRQEQQQPRAQQQQKPRIRAEVEKPANTQTDASGDEVKAIKVTDPETGLAVTVYIPLSMLAADIDAAVESAGAEAVRALRKMGKPARKISASEAERKIFEQVAGVSRNG